MATEFTTILAESGGGWTVLLTLALIAQAVFSRSGVGSSPDESAQPFFEGQVDRLGQRAVQPQQECKRPGLVVGAFAFARWVRSYLDEPG